MKKKMKTRSSAKKRFKKVGGKRGIKIKRARAYRRHLLTKKSKNRKRHLRQATYVSSVDQARIARLLPH